MAYWEFLLQKEGDRSWLPLESPEVEILEGRYRVVARSSYIHTPVEIRITHVAAEENPPKRRTQKRMGQTNKEGLLVVIPFTRLQPGLWELRCTNDLMADLIGESWQYGVKLQSLSQDAELSGDWDPDWSSNGVSSAPSTPTPVSASLLMPLEGQQIPLAPPTLDQQEALTELVQPAEPEEIQPEENPAEVGTTATAEAEDPPVAEQLPPHEFNEAIAPTTQISTPAAALRSLAEEMSQQVIDSAFDIFERESFTDDTPEYPVVQPVVQRADPLPSVPPLTIAGQPVQLHLTSEAYVARSGRAVELTGQIILAPAAGTTSEAAVAVTLPTSELQIRLIDPQTSQVLAEVLHPIASQPLPATFQVGIAVPPSHHTHLVLGEITLLASVAGVVSAIAPQSFTITADLNELLEAIANEEEAEVARRDQEQTPPATADAFADGEPPESSQPEPSDSRNIAALNFRSIPKQFPIFQPSIGMTMPPQIRRDPSKKSSSGPQLPVLPAPTPPAPPIPDDVVEDLDPDADALDLLETALSDEPLPEATNQAEPEMDSVAIEAVEIGLEDEEAIRPDVFLGEEPLASDSFMAIGPDAPIFELERNTDWSYSETELRSPLEVEFQALNLEDRFLARLSAMATDPELAASLDPNRGSQPEPAQAQPVSPPDPTPEEAPPPLEMEAPETEEPEAADAIPDPWFDGPSEEELTAHEIVVYDLEELEPPPPVTPQPPVPSPAVVPEPIARPAPQPPSPPNLEDEIPVSMHAIRIPDGDFVAGQTVEMTVQFAPTPLRTYIKFWLSDRQTRTLLDGPHWLVDFTPNGLGQMECQTQFAVPYGCLELQLEATAVEMATQRESPKVTLNREVIPPDAPALSLDEFDL